MILKVKLNRISKANAGSVRCVMGAPKPLRAYDQCGNAFSYVRISGQTWMADDMRCNKYAQESEAYAAGIETVPEFTEQTYTAQYRDASDKKWWRKESELKFLSEEQIAKLGYLYSWAAAVGLANGETQLSAFDYDRQGICPNGWHIPSRAEFNTLISNIEADFGEGKAGARLKVVDGWWKNSEATENFDSYGFGSLPTGFQDTDNPNKLAIGFHVDYWTSSMNPTYPTGAFGATLLWDNDNVTLKNYYKYCSIAVRCIKD